MIFRRLMVLSVIVFALAGCAVAERREAQLVDTPVFCNGEKDCMEKWEKAEVWVTNNSKWRIQRASNTVIQTYGPGTTEADTAFKITKIPLGDGKYEIRMEARCNNWFGCFPKPAEAKHDFYNYIK